MYNIPSYTYIAADWDTDKSIVDTLLKWKDDPLIPISFNYVHELKQSRDTSLNCSIKKSLKERMDICHQFILIVGENTISCRAGSCQYCSNYNSLSRHCNKFYTASTESYIEYECRMALEKGLHIVVIYNSTTCDVKKCPEILRHHHRVVHIPLYIEAQEPIYNYQGSQISYKKTRKPNIYQLGYYL